jgi:hypothetical protein
MSEGGPVVVKENVFYFQQFGNGDQIFAKFKGTFGNGNHKAIFIRKDVDRKAARVIRGRVSKEWSGLWKEAEFVPQDVLTRCARYESKYEVKT